MRKQMAFDINDIESKRNMISIESEMPPELPANELVFCNWCKNKTIHNCKADYYRNILVEEKVFPNGYLYSIGYRLWMCAGCGSCLLEEYFGTESALDEKGNFIYSSWYYPDRAKYHITAKSFHQLPVKLNTIYGEVVQASSDNHQMLSALGIRALIEGICADQEIGGKNLETKIDGLSSVLPKNIVENVHSIRFMGNEAAHELSAPSREELQLAIEICEDLLNFLYEIDYKESYLTQIREKRLFTDSNINLEIPGES